MIEMSRAEEEGLVDEMAPLICGCPFGDTGPRESCPAFLLLISVPGGMRMFVEFWEVPSDIDLF
ncbi:MAG: hypothetical protein M2R45_00609 [Verrucomicrobia subdivision 3 bacterium]|nr:hypothetical protein [Limisphaerales bacterium]MCS1414507.1 hypothetical protein [Limisphaerales bacterium]